MAEIETILHCEIDPFCQRVLRYHYPDVPIVKDVNDVEEIKRIVANATSSRERIGQQERMERQVHGEAGWEQGSDSTQSQDRDAGNPEGDTGNQVGEIRQGQNTLTRGSDSTTQLILTAGFPCQPFSCAGRRKGKGDSRYLWPQTLAVITAVRPDWVLLENVAGILSMVLPDSETPVASQASFCEVPNDQIADYDTISGGIDRDLRQAGYETLWLVIPACGVGAPHRRDRTWIIAKSMRERPSPIGRQIHIGADSGSTSPVGSPDSADGSYQDTIGTRARSNGGEATDERGGSSQDRRESIRQEDRTACPSRFDSADRNATNTPVDGCQGGCEKSRTEKRQGESGWLLQPQREDCNVTDAEHNGLPGTHGTREAIESSIQTGKNSVRELEGGNCLQDIPGWQENWYEVATRFCRVDDGLPRVVDRVARLKALGNAIVPSVAYEVIKTIVEVSHEE